jgi:rhamnogalacturonan endolyase
LGAQCQLRLYVRDLEFVCVQNYIHWSQYGPTYIDNRTITGLDFLRVLLQISLVEPGFGSLADFNNWQINFDLPEPPLSSSVATFTIQLAAAKTTAGNTDANTGSNPSFSVSIYANCKHVELTSDEYVYVDLDVRERRAGVPDVGHPAVRE